MAIKDTGSLSQIEKQKLIDYRKNHCNTSYFYYYYSSLIFFITLSSLSLYTTTTLANSAIYKSEALSIWSNTFEIASPPGRK